MSNAIDCISSTPTSKSLVNVCSSVVKSTLPMAPPNQAPGAPWALVVLVASAWAKYLNSMTVTSPFFRVRLATMKNWLSQVLPVPSSTPASGSAGCSVFVGSLSTALITSSPVYTAMSTGSLSASPSSLMKFITSSLVSTAICHTPFAGRLIVAFEAAE